MHHLICLVGHLSLAICIKYAGAKVFFYYKLIFDLAIYLSIDISNLEVQLSQCLYVTLEKVPLKKSSKEQQRN